MSRGWNVVMIALLGVVVALGAISLLQKGFSGLQKGLTPPTQSSAPSGR